MSKLYIEKIEDYCFDVHYGNQIIFTTTSRSDAELFMRSKLCRSIVDKIENRQYADE